jgi:hypothetical protein
MAEARALVAEDPDGLLGEALSKLTPAFMSRCSNA